jgi:DNA-binding MarR family transcriptional regulator
MPDLNLDVDAAEREADHQIHDNFFKDFVAFSRSNQLLNEPQAMITLMGMGTGLLEDWQDYQSLIVTGGSSSGKSHMLREVIMEALQYADRNHEWVYELTGGSDKAAVDDDELDMARIAYFHELQKVPDEMLEFIKSVSEDGGFQYGRNVADPESESGRTTVHIEKEPLSVIFSFADENESAAGSDQELRTRLIEVKVDENPEKNEGVHYAKWGERNIRMDSGDEYMFDDEELAHAVKSHIRDVPVDTDVVLPTDDGRFSSCSCEQQSCSTSDECPNWEQRDDWHAGVVTAPMFTFGRSESTRASAQLASLCKASALWNYHNRDAVCMECSTVYSRDEADEHDYECPDCTDDSEGLKIIAAPTDVVNLIECRPTLLATTHGLTEKKFAVLDAIQERGGQSRQSATAVQAPKQSIIEAIQQNDDIASMTKHEIESILDELDENLIINVVDNPEDRRENLYVYDGGATFEAPAIGEYYDHFADVHGPVRDEPIERTIERQQEDLNAKMDMESLTAESREDSSDGSLSGFGDEDGPDHSAFDEDATAVAERLAETVDGYTVPSEVVEANTLKVSHMVGDSPIDVDDGVVRPEREPSGADRQGGFLAPEGVFDDCDSFNDVDERVSKIIAELQSEGVFVMEPNDDGSAAININW